MENKEFWDLKDQCYYLECDAWNVIIDIDRDVAVRKAAVLKMYEGIQQLMQQSSISSPIDEAMLSYECACLFFEYEDYAAAKSGFEKALPLFEALSAESEDDIYQVILKDIHRRLEAMQGDVAAIVSTIAWLDETDEVLYDVIVHFGNYPGDVLLDYSPEHTLLDAYRYWIHCRRADYYVEHADFETALDVIDDVIDTYDEDYEQYYEIMDAEMQWHRFHLYLKHQKEGVEDAAATYLNFCYISDFPSNPYHSPRILKALEVLKPIEDKMDKELDTDHYWHYTNLLKNS